MHKIGDDTPTADGNGEFKETPVPTDLRSAFMTTIQRELVKVVEASGQTLDPNDDNQIFKALQPNWIDARPIGTQSIIDVMNNMAVATMTDTDIAVAESSSGRLRACRFNGDTFVQVGSVGSVSGPGYYAIAAFNPTDIALISSIDSSLTLRRFNGVTWSTIGTGLTITGLGIPAMAALNSVDVAIIGDGLDELRTYRCNLTTGAYAQVGSGLAIAGCTSPKLAAMDPTHVAYADTTNNLLTMYSFDFSGGAWSQLGAGLVLADGIQTLTAINDTDVVILDGNTVLKFYRFNHVNNTWSKVGIDTLPAITGLASSGYQVITAVNGTDIACSYSGGYLRMFRASFQRGAGPYRP